MHPQSTEVAGKFAGGVDRLALNSREAREALGGISTTTLWRLEKAGHIRPLPGLRMKLFSVKALRRYVEQGGRAA